VVLVNFCADLKKKKVVKEMQDFFFKKIKLKFATVNRVAKLNLD
jgi:hypothetical protein